MRQGASNVAPDLGSTRRTDFDRIYREQRRAVERHLLYLTGDRSLAEDLTQETFGRLYERGLDPGTADVPRNERAWLLTVASNLAYNHFRGESRRVAREEAVAPAMADGARSDHDAVLDVRAALQGLEPRDRTVLLLRHAGFSYAEIARAVDLAPGSIGTILARAQGRFRSAYEGAARGASEKE
jgi:RNA polymerase sigma-70 factor, ECF subfamily